VGLGDTYTPSQLAAAMRKAGFPESVISTGVAISFAESGIRGVKSRTDPNSWGPWQINRDVHNISIEAANDLQKSTNYAYKLWKASGWDPWSAYTAGSYQPYLNLPIEGDTLVRTEGRPVRFTYSPRQVIRTGQTAQQLGLAPGVPAMPNPPEPFSAPFNLDQAKEIIRRAYMLYPELMGMTVQPRSTGMEAVEAGRTGGQLNLGFGISSEARRAQAELFINSSSDEAILRMANHAMVNVAPRERLTLSADITPFYNQQEQQQKQQAEAEQARQSTAGITGYIPQPIEPDPLEGIDPVTATGLYDIMSEVVWDDPDDIFLTMGEIAQWWRDNPDADPIAVSSVLDALGKAHAESIKMQIGTTSQYTSSKDAFDRTMAENRRQFDITSGISQGQLDVSRGGLDEQKRANVEQEKQSIRAELARLQAGRASQELGARTALAGSTLPPGTPYVPGYEPGGAASKLFGGYGAPFTPVVPGQVDVSLQPTEGENVLARALAAMSSGGGAGLPGAPTVGQAQPYSTQIAQELATQAMRGPRY